MKYLPLLSLILVACAPVTKEVKVFSPIPIECDLTQVCTDKEYHLETNRDLALAYTGAKTELAYCSEHLRSLQSCVRNANAILTKEKDTDEKTSIQTPSKN